MSADIRVLHVDDEADFQSLAADFLSRVDDDISLVQATSGGDALEMLGDNNIDCIVSDYEMPNMDGISFLEEVRAINSELPFILFTGKGSEEIASDAITAGVTDYLQKGNGSSQYTVLANRIKNAVEQYRAKQRVEQTEKRYRRLIEAANDVIIVVDDEGKFEYLSPAADRILGYEPHELVGEYGFEYMHPDDEPEVMDLFFKMVENPSLRPRTEFRMRRPDGSWAWVEVEGRNLADDPYVGGHVIYARDISDRR